MKINCKICSKEFVRYGKQALKAVCCSTKCLGEYNKAKPNTKCTNCGIDFHIKESQKKRYSRSMGYFCNKKCLTEYRKEWFKGENNHQYNLKGDLNKSFKGKIISKKNNNLIDKRIYVGDTHPYADKNGRILYHRYLVEKNHNLFKDDFFIKIGDYKVLKKKYDVHHIDGNHNNNDINNLSVLTRSEHTTLHNKEKIIIRDNKGRISGVFKSGELLENLEADNQQPS